MMQNCHPGKSVHAVNKILDAFKNGARDKAEFWIQIKGRFVLIQYYAVRDDEGGYQGTIEVTRDATDIRKLEGERRLLEWE